MTSIPAGSSIQAVDIAVDVTNTSGQDYEFYELNKPWLENQATFNEYASGQSWEVAGADGSSDRGSTILGAIIGSPAGPHTVALNAAGVAVVQGWVDTPSSNNGFIILDYINATNGLDFSSREAGLVTARPMLTITYSGGSSTTALMAENPSDNETTKIPPVLENRQSEVTDSFELKGNYPNPFNSSTVIIYSLPEAAETQITVSDLLGREVAVLVKAFQPAGVHKLQFSMKDLSTGVYFVNMQAGRFKKTHKMLYVK